MLRVETIYINLANTILTQVKLSELPEFLQMFNLYDLVVRGVEYFELFQWAVLESVQVLELIARDVKELKVGHAVKTSLKVAILHARLDKESFNAILTQF